MNCPLVQRSPWYCTLFLTAFLSVLDGRMLDGVTRKQFLRIPETEMCLAEPEVTGSCGNSYIQNGIFKVALQRRRLYKRPHSD